MLNVCRLHFNTKKMAFFGLPECRESKRMPRKPLPFGGHICLLGLLSFRAGDKKE